MNIPQRVARRGVWVAGALVALAGLTWAAAGAQKFQADPNHSSVTFKVKHLGISWVHGRFDKVEGSFVYDQGDPAASTVEVTVDAASVDTNVERRDNHVRSDAFLDVAKYPEISFKSTAVKPKGEGKLEVTGDLTLHGTTGPVTVEAELIGLGPGPQNSTRAGFESTFTVKRSDYGMTTMVGPVGDEVTLTVALEGVLQ